MKLLAFETATEACSVALWIDGELHQRHELAPRRHAELALPWAEQLLAEAGIRKSQLDAIALGRGPGAFTGVRLAIALGQGIALALDRPIVAVSTLAALALGARTAPCAIDMIRAPLADASIGEPQRVLACIDARMGEVYTGAFELREGDAFALDAEAVLAPEAATLPDRHDGWLGVGTGFGAADGALARHLGTRFLAIDASALPTAADVARLAVAAYARGEALAPERVEPAYLRNNVALTIAEQQALRANR